MFLNNLGEPVALDAFQSESLDHAAPLLIGCPEVTMTNIPDEWSGKIYTTRRVIHQLLTRFASNMQKFVEEKRIVELKENESKEVCLPDGSRISITAIPWTKGKQEPKLIFLMKDIYVTRVWIEVLSNMLNTIIVNNSFRAAIQEGIDIVHFNDSFAKGVNLRDKEVQRNWAKLHSLIYLIRPKLLCGLYGTTPPKYVTQCCSKSDNVPPYLTSF